MTTDPGVSPPRADSTHDATEAAIAHAQTVLDGVAVLPRASGDRLTAEAAVRAAAPFLRRAYTEQAAAGGCCIEYGIFQDCTAEGLGHAFIATRHSREDALAAVDRLAAEHPDYPAYAMKRTVSHGAWEPLDTSPSGGVA